MLVFLNYFVDDVVDLRSFFEILLLSLLVQHIVFLHLLLKNLHKALTFLFEILQFSIIVRCCRSWLFSFAIFWKIAFSTYASYSFHTKPYDLTHLTGLRLLHLLKSVFVHLGSRKLVFQLLYFLRFINYFLDLSLFSPSIIIRFSSSISLTLYVLSS